MPLLRWSGMTVHTFRYSTGIEAIRIETPVGEIIMLPFKGQQVWDATFHGRRLTMKSMFDEPQATTDYLANYGAFLIHCGITATGAPGPNDTHALHGELPNARFQTAHLIAGIDAGGPYAGLSGSCQQTRAFGYNYRFNAEIKARPHATHLEVAVSADNLRQAALDVMYLAHINFRPVDHARLVDTVRDDRAGIEVRQVTPSGLAISPANQRHIAELSADPSAHRRFVAGQHFDPEVVLFLECRADAESYAHGLQLHPTGEADFVSYRPRELPVAVRWISRTGDQDALGLILPSTSGVDGYTAEKAKGRVATIAGGGQFTCGYRCGALSKAGAKQLLGRIGNLAKSSVQ